MFSKDLFERWHNNPWQPSTLSKIHTRTWDQKVFGSIPGLCPYIFQGLMIVIATGFIPSSLLSLVVTMVVWENSQWLGKNNTWSTGKKHGWVHSPPQHNWNNLEFTSNFSFSHSVFYPLGELCTIFIEFKNVICKLFQFGRVYTWSFAKGLNCNSLSTSKCLLVMKACMEDQVSKMHVLYTVNTDMIEL